MSTLKFPRRTTFPRLGRAFLDVPAPGDSFSSTTCFHGKQEKGLALYMWGNPPPSLLEALDGLGGYSKQLGHLALCFAQMMSDLGKPIFVHSISLR
jgi:hypothetical protein